jgi:hypothetical protein
MVTLTAALWSKMDIADLRNAVEFGSSLGDAASFMCRSQCELRIKARELGLAFKQPNESTAD